MATVLEECATEEQRSAVHFFVAKELNAKDIHKEMFVLYGGSVCHVKRFTAGSRNFLKDEEVETDAEVAETKIKRLLCCGFRRTVKAMGQVYQCWWRICREVIFFSRFEYHVLRFVPIVSTLPLLVPRSRKLWTHTSTSPYTSMA
jgi:hypothetical protein